MLAKLLPFLMLSPVVVVGCKKEAPPAAAPKPAPRAPIIAPVYFETGSKEIRASEDVKIARAAEIYKDTDWKVLVLGLADATGDAAANRELSEGRAEAVATRLRSKVGGDPNRRIVTYYIGEKLASGGEENAERKVEFVFFKDEGLPLKEVVVKSRVLEEDFRNRR
jgi:outer membrane protein OmpA-like peptidoglycan-associated protein